VTKDTVGRGLPPTLVTVATGDDEGERQAESA